MTMLDDLRAEPLPGDGFVVRRPGALLAVFAEPSSAGASKLVKVLMSTDAGAALARALASVVIEMPPEHATDFCLIADSERGLVVMVHGEVVVRENGGGVLFDGTQSPTWVDGFIDSLDEPIEIAPKGSEPFRSAGPWNVGSGIIQAGGVLLAGDDALPVEMTAAEESTPYPRSPVDSTPMDEPGESDSQFDLVDLTAIEPLEDREPLSRDSSLVEQSDEDSELLTGVFCSRGHFNHPGAHYCAHCGIKMVHLTKNSVKGARPPLGLLVLDDGASFALDTGYVIGREPESDELVRTGLARPMKVTDSSNSVSRVHAEVRLEGWDVEVLDRESSNGTFIHVGDGRWKRLTSGRAHTLEPGHELSVGERRFVFESNVLPRPIEV